MIVVAILLTPMAIEVILSEDFVTSGAAWVGVGVLAAGVGAVDAGVVIIVVNTGAGAPDAVESAAASCASELLQFEARSVYVSKMIPLVSPTAKEDNDVSRAARLRRAKDEALYVSGSSSSFSC